jgi:FO synthase
MTYRDYILNLKNAGLGSIPGTAAEILDTTIRKQLTRDKLSTDDWVTIIRTAHDAGIPSTATIMYGHIDSPEHWAAHLDLLRQIQQETGGFTELVPLGFVHYDSPLYHRRDDVRPGPSADESLKMHAVARVMLHGWIDNIQVSWVKLGHEMAVKMLQCGANDLGGTLMNESISRAAGAKHGQEVTPAEMAALIRAAGRIPVQRNTLYDVLEVFDCHDPVDMAPLVPRQSATPIVPASSCDQPISKYGVDLTRRSSHQHH